MADQVTVEGKNSELELRYRDGANNVSRLLTVEEVATLLNVPRKWVYRRVVLKSPKGIPHVKVGKYLRFRETDLRDFVERLRRN
jgi:excisionase family DNA binding protein